MRTTSAPAWLSPASYWQPARIVSSAWLEHAPFAFWLMDELRPRSVVELGTHWGFSFFVFAEAVRRLGIETEVSALDSWEGDDQAGFYGEDVYESVRSTAEQEYPGFTRLLRGYFSDSRPSWPTTASTCSTSTDGTATRMHARTTSSGARPSETAASSSSTTSRSTGTASASGSLGGARAAASVVRLLPRPRPRRARRRRRAERGPGRPLRCRCRDGARRACDVRAPRRAVVARQAKLEAMPAEMDSLHLVVESLTGEIDRLKGVIGQREAAIDEYRRSTSWKVTRPLRAVGDVLHRDRGART